MQRSKEILWPTAGWLRTFTYWGHRLIRLQATPYSIAAGLATGVAISMTPFIGLHLVLTLLICWALGAHFFAGVIGSLIGNPWTFPVIWMATYRLGSAMLGMEAGTLMDFEISVKGLFHNPFNAVVPTFGPMIVGSLPIGFVAWVLVFIPTRRIIDARQKHRQEKLAGARGRRENLIAGGKT